MQIGDKTYSAGVNSRSFASNLSRTATSAAELFTIPPYSVIKDVRIIGAKSDAGTSARISLSSNGGSTGGLLAQFNVKTNGAVSYPSSWDPLWASTNPNPVTVTGLYAEDGAGSSTGGPWTVILDII